MERTSRIAVLPPAVINKIAAGEVIERPASVIKELLENSLDALSTRIDIAVEDGGMELIRIADDGEGIPPEELPLAVQNHATSKLIQSDDLFRVQTMGFRGEALASISEVSNFRIRSRTHEAEIGSEMAVQFGERSDINPLGMAPGTQIEIRQLFSNTPVRRKFLKKASTEFGYVNEQFTRVALATPRLDLSLTHNGKTVHRLPATADLSERLLHFFGAETVDKLIPVETTQSGIRLWGYVGHPSQNKSTRKSQYLFLNGRAIQDRSLQHALAEAYRGLIMTGRHPIAFLFLEMPSDQVDVNVHPTKAEVRFRDQQFLFRLLLSTLRTQFLKADLQSNLALPTAKPQSADELQEKQRRVERDLVNWARNRLMEQVPATPPANQSTEEAAESSPTSNQSTAPSVPPFKPFEDPGQPFQAAPSRSFISEQTVDSTSNEEQSEPVENSVETNEVVTPASPAPSLIGSSSIQALQVDDCYIVLSTDQGLTVIDQHALHERVLYERMRKKVLEGGVEIQKLLMPVTINMSSEQLSMLIEHTELLLEMGFEVSDFGGGMLAVNSHPVFLGRSALEEVMREFAENFSDSKQVSRRDLLDTALHMMACKAAIKAGQRLTTDEIIALLAQREETDEAHHCPHGRPTALVLSREDLDRQFGRLGA